jgi:hypothetical protein
MISREVKPQEPRIKGVPTKMVIFNRAASGEDWGLYVGAASLHRYAQAADGSGGALWDEADIPQPRGKIFDLAATQNYLYALTGSDSTTLYRLGKESAAWEEVGFAAGDQGFSQIQAIFGEVDSEGIPLSDYLFVGASTGSPQQNGIGDFGIFYTDGAAEGKLTLLVSDTAILTGAAYDTAGYHYVSTNGDGLYYAGGSSSGASFSGASFQKIPPGELSLQINGLINIGSADLALCYNGDILRVSGGTLTKLNTESLQFNFRGAAAVWKDDKGLDTLLLVAVRNSDPVYGYREIRLNPGNPAGLEPGAIELWHPGDESPTTVGDDKQFRDTIEPKPVNAIVQVPARIDPNRVLLVSIHGTGQNTGFMENSTDGGLWSYRARDGIWQWNAEN